MTSETTKKSEPNYAEMILENLREIDEIGFKLAQNKKHSDKELRDIEAKKNVMRRSLAEAKKYLEKIEDEQRKLREEIAENEKYNTAMNKRNAKMEDENEAKKHDNERKQEIVRSQEERIEELKEEMTDINIETFENKQRIQRLNGLIAWNSSRDKKEKKKLRDNKAELEALNTARKEISEKVDKTRKKLEPPQSNV